ncbi:MAG: YjdF family protein [Oscillospiraceae bacterium]|nr:YjdF family protein [Oscillospiraceae bacterium]MCI9363942.1 YjdF family protein [Oscillospiraceae bacterium]MCI9669590.1 YjdF family protein [Oscillospiraceae bacterium]
MIYKGIFTVLFENPFWIGLYERIEGERYEVCKITFGTEPKDYEVYDYWLANCDKLQFSQPIKIEKTEERKTNPKRVQREINHQLQKKGIGTKAQQALKAQHEQVKIERKTQSREEKEAEKERQFILKQEKKKAKHKGK